MVVFFISLLLLFHILFRWRWLLLLVLVCSQCFCVQQINFFLRIYAVLMFRNNWNDVKSARTRSSSKGKKWITHLSISADWSARVFFFIPVLLVCRSTFNVLLWVASRLYAYYYTLLNAANVLEIKNMRKMNDIHYASSRCFFSSSSSSIFWVTFIPNSSSNWKDELLTNTEKCAFLLTLSGKNCFFFINDNAQIRYFLHNSIKSTLWLTVAW